MEYRARINSKYAVFEQVGFHYERGNIIFYNRACFLRRAFRKTQGSADARAGATAAGRDAVDSATIDHLRCGYRKPAHIELARAMLGR